MMVRDALGSPIYGGSSKQIKRYQNSSSHPGSLNKPSWLKPLYLVLKWVDALQVSMCHFHFCDNGFRATLVGFQCDQTRTLTWACFNRSMIFMVWVVWVCSSKVLPGTTLSCPKQQIIPNRGETPI